MDTRINVDLDTKWSWVVAVGSCWVNFCIYGLWRSYGLLYVGFQEKYGISHQNASTPFLYACAIYHLIGPVVGILSYKYSYRSLQMIGCLLAASGVAMVNLSTNFTMVIIGVGIVQGLGLGIIRTLSNVVIQNYFYKYRAIATSISMSGGVFSSFFFPTLGSYLLANYKFENCFLIFGFIIFLASIGILVQREPRYKNNSINIGEAFNVNIEKLDNSPANQAKCLKCWNTELKCETCKSALNSQSNGTKFNSQFDSTINQYSNATDQLTISNNLDKAEHLTETTLNQSVEKKKNIFLSRQEGSAIFNLIFVIKKPMFYVISITFVVYNICLQVFIMTIVDMTKKFEINRDDVGIRLISMFSLADLIGRLSAGWFLDKKYLSLKNVAVLCELTIFTVFLILPNLNTLVTIQIASFMIGLMIGVITILWPLLNVDYFGTDKLAILLGLNCFLSGLESLARPFLIGLYLDHYRNYKYLYYNIAGFIAIVTCLWVVEPLLNRKKK